MVVVNPDLCMHVGAKERVKERRSNNWEETRERDSESDGRADCNVLVSHISQYCCRHHNSNHKREGAEVCKCESENAGESEEDTKEEGEEEEVREEEYEE